MRRAEHAGTWYTADGDDLDAQLTRYLSSASSPLAERRARALICPHAGYSYSGPTAAYAYLHLQPNNIKRVFVIGPSHHAYLEKIALPSVAVYETPLGNLEIDTEVVRSLHETGMFELMSADVDEEEHSIEMQLPYIAKQLGRDSGVKLVPMMVGNISARDEEEYGRLLAPLLDKPENFFIISSDFCHWGKRFRYTPYDQEHGAVHRSIEAMDRRGMQLIEAKDAEGFHRYIKETKNTICGRHPIAVLLHALQNTRTRLDVQFVHYAQSSAAASMNDSSVSYAAGVVYEAD